MDAPLRFLVLDAYDRAGRAELEAGGASAAGDLYARMLGHLAPAARVDVANPADPDFALPEGVALADYDGVAWTGSSLAIHKQGDPRVERQVELARASFQAGVPAFGSCWAAQIACVAAGGRCAPNPRGREFGLARKIALSDAGRRHPLYQGKPPVFDAFTSHQDEVVAVPPDGAVLAGNRFTPVQAVEVRHGRGVFWGLQYHPEYDLHELARLTHVRADALVAQGSFAGRAEALAWADRLEALHRDPSRKDIAFQLGVDEDVLDPVLRQMEVRNWIEVAVIGGRRR